MASGSAPDATFQDQPTVESQNQPEARPHEQAQDQQLSQTQDLSQAQPQDQPHDQLQAQQQAQQQAQPHVQPPAEPQDQQQSRPEVQPQGKSQAPPKHQQQAQQQAQPQAQLQAYVAPTPVVKEKSFGVVLLQIFSIAIASALFFVMVVVVFKHRKLAVAAGSGGNLCASMACDRLAGALISSLQPELDPCDDFHAFVCGRFTGMHATGTVFSDMKAELWRLVKDKVVTGADPTFATVTTTPPPSHHSILNKIQALFASCLRPPVNDSTAPLKAFVDSQGLGFPGKVPATDVLLTMLRLSYLYDVQSVLSARLLAVKSQPRGLLLRASVNKRYVWWLADRPENVSFSYRVLLDVYGKVENADQVVQRISDTENVVRRLADAATKKNASAHELIVEEKDLHYYGNGAVRALLSSLRSSLPSETLQLLVSWDVVRTMAPLVSPATVPAEGGTRFSRCWRLVQRSLGVPAVAAYLLDKLAPNTTEEILKMTKELRATYNALFSNEAFIWHSVPKSVLSEFQELQATPLFFASGVRSKEQLDAFYGAYPYAREDDSFLDTWIKVCQLADETQRNASGLDLDNLLTPNALTLAATTSNKILLPAPVLLLPLFSTDGLVSTNFGGLGHVLAHGMLRKLHNGLVGASKNSSSDLERYKAHLECAQRSPINESLSSAPDAGGAANADWTTGISGVADLVGLHVAYETFSARMQRRTLPSTNLTEKQAFFAVSCFKFCSMAAAGTRSATQTSGPVVASGASTVSRERCNAPLKNMKAFADAFKCKPSSPMNPARKCTFW